jgi:hypothetical protein
VGWCGDAAPAQRCFWGVPSPWETARGCATLAPFAFGGLGAKRSTSPRCTFDLRGTHNEVGGVKHLAGLFCIRNRCSGRPAQEHPAKGWRRQVRYNQQLRASANTGNHHDALTLVPPTRHRLPAVAHRVQISRPLRRRPVDADVVDFAQRSMQSLDELGQFTCDRSRARPPRPIDVAAQEGGQGNPHGSGQTPRARHAVHGYSDVAPGAFASGRSEKVGCSTGPTEASPEEIISGSCG